MPDEAINEKDYVKKANKIANSDNREDPIEIVNQLAELDIPDNSLVASEIYSAVSELEYEADTTYDYLNGEELNKKLRGVADDILSRVKMHLSNYGQNNLYHQEYALVAVYEGRRDGWVHTESVEKKVDTDSVQEAKKLAQEWLTSAPNILDSAGNIISAETASENFSN